MLEGRDTGWHRGCHQGGSIPSFLVLPRKEGTLPSARMAFILCLLLQDPSGSLVSTKKQAATGNFPAEASLGWQHHCSFQ